MERLQLDASTRGYARSPEARRPASPGRRRWASVWGQRRTQRSVRSSSRTCWCARTADRRAGALRDGRRQEAAEGPRGV